MKQLYQMLSLFVLIFSVNQLNANVIENSTKNEISELVAPTAKITVSANSVCQNAANPVITFTGTGGTAPYTFTYTLDGATKTISTTTGDSITLLAPTTTVGTFNYTLVSVVDTSNSPTAITGQSEIITDQYILLWGNIKI